MLKKISIIVSIFFIFLCIATLSFATDNVKNAVNSGVNTVVDGVDNLGSDVRNGIGDVENGIENVFKDDGEAMTFTNETGNYNASRIDTSTAGITGAGTDTLWIWVIVAIAAIIIIGLVWYYASQDNAINSRH